VLVAPGSYPEIVMIDGVNLVLASWFLTTGDSAYIDSTILEGDSVRRILSIRGGVDSTTLVTGFTIQNGRNATAGGGIDCWSSGPRIEHNVIRDNQTHFVGGGLYLNAARNAQVRYNEFTRNSFYGSFGDGGGVCIEGGSATVEYNVFLDNHASRKGGGFSTYDANVTVANNQFIGNVADLSGGAVSATNSSVITIRNNTLRGNSADSSGGGLYVTSSSRGTIFENVIDSNTTPDRGGGVYLHSTDTMYVQFNEITNNASGNYGGGLYIEGVGGLYLTDNVIAGDSSTSGGGMYVHNSQMDVFRNVLRKNVSYSSGGAAILSLGAVDMSNNTLIDNRAHTGTGAALSVQWGAPTITHNIIAGHSGVGAIRLLASIPLTHSCFYNNGQADFTGALSPGLGSLDSVNANGDSCDVYGNIQMHPEFCDPFVGDFRLAATSHVLGAGESGADLGALPVGCSTPVIKADVTANGTITSADIIYMVNFVFKAGPEPLPRLENGDVTCDGSISSADIIYLVNLVFKAGPLSACW